MLRVDGQFSHVIIFSEMKQSILFQIEIQSNMNESFFEKSVLNQFE